MALEWNFLDNLEMARTMSECKLITSRKWQVASSDGAHSFPLMQVMNRVAI